MADQLPTGVVTLLMTDIEGSTRAWQSARDGLARDVQHHYEVLGRWVGDHGGVRPEEQGEGDSVVAGFADPVSALAAAVGAQRELLAELPDLPVRMALHTGEATLRNDRNYAGLTIIRCARIRSCGHGGQILVSRRTLEAIGERLPGDVGVQPLGWYGLKGLSGRTEIAQVVADGLPASFPPLQAGASASGNLPRPVSSFTGRRRELAELTSLVDGHRWVSVVGGAGVGKTRLALAAATASAEAFPGGVWWVPLSSLSGGSVDDVASAIAGTCTIERRGRSLDDVTSFFGGVAATLLVLDGLDGVTASGIAIVRHLLATVPELRVVTTAGEAAAVAGETPFRLEPYEPPVASTVAGLAATDAGELFLDRLRGAGGQPSLSPGEVEAVVRICTRWNTAADLEMVAIRAASTPLLELADDLERLGGSATSALASSASWHLRSLGAVERRVLQRCAVFRSSMDPDAVVAVVVGDDLDAADAQSALAVLTERRVVRDDGERLHLDARFRDVIATWPPDPGLDAVVDRYVAWCTSVAEHFDAGGVDVLARWLSDDLDDVMSALVAACRRESPHAYRLVTALAPRWHELDRWTELEAACDWLASRSPSDGELAWVAAVSRLSFAAAGLPGAAVHALVDEAVAIARLDGDDISCDYLAYGPSAAALAAGDPGPALELFDAAIAHGAEPVALAVASRLLGSPSTSHRPALDAVVDGRSDAACDPIAAAVARRADRRDDGAPMG